MWFFLMVHNSSERFVFQVKLLEGPSEEIIPQLKKKYEVDTLDFVFLDHWKDRYRPDTILLQVSLNNSSLKSKVENTLMSVRPLFFKRDIIWCKMKTDSQNSSLRRKENLKDGTLNFCLGELPTLRSSGLSEYCWTILFLNIQVCSRNPTWRSAWPESYTP